MWASSQCSLVFEGMPVQAQLMDNPSHRASLQIFRTPIRKGGPLSRRRIHPLPMEPTGPARYLLAAQPPQLPLDLTIGHATVTGYSNVMCIGSLTIVAGSGLPRSAYSSTTAEGIFHVRERFVHCVAFDQFGEFRTAILLGVLTLIGTTISAVIPLFILRFCFA
jgi:hypothetical protein